MILLVICDEIIIIMILLKKKKKIHLCIFFATEVKTIHMACISSSQLIFTYLS